METLSHALKAASESGDRGFWFIDRKENERRYTYSLLWKNAQRFAQHLRQTGVQDGERVAIILPTCEAFLDAFFGCHLANAVPVPLYPPVRLGRIDEYLERTQAMLRGCDAKMIVSNKRVLRIVGRRLSEALGSLVVLDVASLQTSSTATSAPTLPTGNQIALVQFTSGSTSDPKGVALTHAQLLANAQAVAAHIPKTPGSPIVGVCWLPLYHDMGLVGCVCVAALVSGNLALLGPETFLQNPSLWLRAISRHRAIISPAPNFAYGLCVDKIADDQMQGVDLSSWRMALNGAEPLAPRVLERFNARFSKWGLRPEALTPVYGLAEAALAVTFSQIDLPYIVSRYDRAAMAEGLAERGGTMDLVSVGRPLDGYRVQVRDKERNALEERRVGHVWISGPSLMEGYVSPRGAAVQDGWFDTGDLGFIDEDNLYITGRDKDIVVHRGKNHAAHDIEHACDEVPGVRKGCVVAVSSIDDAGEHAYVFAEARDPRPTLANECRKAIRSHAGIDIERIRIVAPGTLPRTSSGKLRRHETLRRYENGTLNAAPVPSTWTVIWEMIKDRMRGR